MFNEMVSRGRLASVLAEFLGTAMLVMVAIVLTETTAVSYFIGTSVAATLAVGYIIFSGISGAHFNPAITFGMWAARRMRSMTAVVYIVAQLLGGLAAWQLFQYFTDHKLTSHSVTFSFSLFLAEAVGTFILSLGFAAAASRAGNALESGLTYGIALFVGILIASTAAGGYLNPAVALGLRSFDWVYILGPLAGGLVGINLYTYLFAPDSAASSRKLAARASVVVKRSSKR